MAKKRTDGSKLIQPTKIDEMTHRAFTILCYQSGVDKKDVMRILVERFVEDERFQRRVLREAVE